MVIQALNVVNIYNDHHYDINNFNDLAQNILNNIAKKLKQVLPWCVAVIFCDQDTSLQLNKTYRKKEYIPDVLAFGNADFNDHSGEEQLQDLGDIFICYAKAKWQAEEYGHSLIRELSFLFLHGLLHTLGYDHQKIVDEKIMFALQTEILNELNIVRK